MNNNQSKNSDMFLGATPSQFSMAEVLRRHETDAEKLLWSKINRKQLGVKFRRQHPLLDYIVDFYCHAHRLVIEVDGSIHNTPQNANYDQSRKDHMERFGIRTIRFTNDEVLQQTDKVVEAIQAVLIGK